LFGTVREGVVARHLRFAPVAGVQVSPDSLQVIATKELVRSAPAIKQQAEELSSLTNQPSTTTSRGTTPRSPTTAEAASRAA